MYAGQWVVDVPSVTLVQYRGCRLLVYWLVRDRHDRRGADRTDHFLDRVIDEGFSDGDVA